MLLYALNEETYLSNVSDVSTDVVVVMPIGRVSHIDCSGLDITTVSSLLFFSLRIAYSLQGLPQTQWGQRKISH